MIGLSTFLPDIFKGIRWSSSEVLARTQDKLNELDIKFKLLKPHIDIDSVDDLKSLRRILRTNTRDNLDRLGNIVRVL